MPFIKIDKENSADTYLRYEDRGQGEPLVLIHGYPFIGRSWQKIETRFIDEGYRVITYDRRGFGLSSATSFGYDYDTFARDLHALLEHLDLESATLIGHSMGTGEIARYMGDYGSERIGRAVFIAPILPFLLKTDDNPQGLDKKIFDEFKEQIKKDRYAFTTEFLNKFYNVNKLSGLKTSAPSEEVLRHDFTVANAASSFGFYHCVEAWLTDFRKDLPKIDVPSLVIHGDSDQILPIEITGKRLAEEIKAEFKVIPGGSHGITWTHADEICEEILKFFEAHPHVKHLPKKRPSPVTTSIH